MSSFWETVLDCKKSNSSRDCPLPALVDDIAKRDPRRVCLSFPRSRNFAEGFQDITFHTFANAINKTAHYLQREIGRSSMFETVFYMGYPDVRHYIVLIALMKTGHKVLFHRQHESLAMEIELIKRTDCSILLFTPGAPIERILQHCRLESICMLELEYLLDDSRTCAPYPYMATLDQARLHPCVVTHIPSSTGRPKPIIWTHGALWDAQQWPHPASTLRHDSLFDTLAHQPLRLFSTCSRFDGPEIFRSLKQALCQNTTIVIPRPYSTSVDEVHEVLRYGNIDVLECTSGTLDKITTRLDILERLRKLQNVTCIGGKLSSQALFILSHYVQVHIPRARTEPSTPLPCRASLSTRR
ncbi:uncharacterized protein EI97DRAFT_207907 [Westerdykella ornata]|uniref:Uncharacterized protein n=1 Tax=Westerdykella ornata TaxID=318751 RepID=A0A6A6JA61_WESOR|nr:uncharacterized protein EI97DRAFT_207907 [Westerdykella ornata]KAF2272516.1 hypothetical protein EI97DRAFT_207907 [Westerdykella ornata]